MAVVHQTVEIRTPKTEPKKTMLQPRKAVNLVIVVGKCMPKTSANQRACIIRFPCKQRVAYVTHLGSTAFPLSPISSLAEKLGRSRVAKSGDD